MKSNTTTILVAVGALLVGGVATAAFLKGGDSTPVPAIEAPLADAGLGADDSVADNAIDADANGLRYADVLKVEPVTRGETQYATVIGTEPVRETTTTSTPREVCQDVVVQERQAERDGNVGGTVAGAVIGGLIGNQVGGGSGKKAATAAGAVAGGMIGNKVDKNHVGGQVVSRTERQCHTENASSESSRVTGYNVTYRNPDGSTGTMRTDKKPGNRIAMGNANKVIGYDVTYRLDGEEGSVRLDEKPEGDRLPVVNGQVVTQTASVASPEQG